MDAATRLRGETDAVWATACAFALGAGVALAVLGGAARPLVGEHGLGVPIAVIAALVTAAAFVVSTLRHRRGETAPMPPWQRVVSDLSAIALTIALAAVCAMGVLLVAQILAAGLQGLELDAWGGAVLAGVASAVGGRFAFGAGIGLRTIDIAGLLFGYLVIGALFSMVTAADPRWWEHNFSTLGGGAGSWAFNGTVVIAGLLMATVGSYIGRDLHRILGDDALPRIAVVVSVWTLTGVGLAGVGVFPLDRMRVVHNIVAFVAFVLFALAAVMTARTIPGAPTALTITTAGLIALVVLAAVLCFGVGVFGVTAMEAVVIGLGMLWMLTLVRVLGILAPSQSRASARAHPLRGEVPERPNREGRPRR